MHELAITRNLINQVLAEANRVNASKVNRIRLLIGENSPIVPECVRFYFEHLREDPLLENTQLEFIRIPLRLRCPKCGQEFSNLDEICSCNAGADIIGGDELLIESIDIE